MKRLALLLLVVLSPVAAPAAMLQLQTADPEPAAGQLISVDVTLADVEIGCYSFSVEFDSSCLLYLGATEGELFASAPQTTWFSDDVDGSGRPQPNACVLGYQTTVAGPGVIARLDFEVLDASPAVIALRDPVLRDADRLAMPGVEEAALGLNGATTSAPAIGAGALLVAPNPSGGPVRFLYSAGVSAPSGPLKIYDLAGRLVRALEWPEGADSRAWDGLDAGGEPVANGVYVARLGAGPGRATARIVRVR